MIGRGLVASALTVLCPALAWAQTLSTPEMLRALPAGDNLFSLIEAAQPEVTTDRFNGGGLNGGHHDRASAFLASWTQSQYLIGDASISSPIDGTPMLFPDLALFSLIGVSASTRGLEIGLRPHLKHGNWSGAVEALGSGGVLSQASSSPHAPAIAQLDSFARLSGLVSGTVVRNLEFTAGAAYTRSATVERPGTRLLDTPSLFASSHYAFGASAGLLTTALIQPDAWHAQSTYDRAGQWRVYGSVTARRRDPGAMPAFRQADRLIDGPIPSLLASRTREHRAAAGTRLERRRRRQLLSAGVDVERVSSATDPIPNLIIVERVDDLPARMWRYRGSPAASRRQGLQLRAFAGDRISLTRTGVLTIGIGFDAAAASATGARNGISWRSLLPAAELHWDVGTSLRLGLTTGVSRNADRPLLDSLAVGDPHAPTADVYRWDAQTLGLPLVMRVGPGTAGDPDFSAIDRELRRPATDQFFLQLAAAPWRWFRVRVTGLARRQSSSIAVVNIGVPSSAYTMFTIPDANADWVHPRDDQQLPVYNRQPESFGRDRYRLTNPDVEDATMGALVVSAEIQQPRVLFRIGGTASASVGAGGNRGFTALENDQSVLGELFTNPNALTNARGRLFNDRAYTIKSLAILRFSSAITLGALARFQDGQPFARLAVVSGLNQGAEAIQAFPRGRSRFSYWATLDVRLQNTFNLDAIGFDVMADAYNLLNQSNEVEEYVVTGPRFREITAVQPPRAFHLGARVSF